MSASASDPITVFGAGSIGCFLGTSLAAAGAAVTLVARPRIIEEIRAHGLSVSDLDGVRRTLPAEAFTLVSEIGAAPPSSLYLVTVKSRHTAAAAAAIAPALGPQGRVISFQNGLRNAGLLAQTLGAERVIAGMVPFNVVHQGQGHFHRGTEGTLAIASAPALDAHWHQYFARAGLPLTAYADFDRVLWSKLLLNLNNPINALAGVPLLTELGDADYRRCLAAVMAEALGLVRSAGIRPVRLAAAPPGAIPWILRLPTWAFTRVAGRMLAIDPDARSSMWEDLQQGRPTEIDELNGEIVHLGQRIGQPAPLNALIVALVRAAEDAGQGSPGLTGADLWSKLRAATTWGA
ncbi:2-dehydropantoate 2-reductase [Haliangium sp.]|uniref:2-dehydropantoate 2-reductase n=1 Tax=Haliangium sp. TaxID=2663208 RepID=UPI003D143038